MATKRKTDPVKALVARLDAVEEITERHARVLSKHARRFRSQDSVIAELKQAHEKEAALNEQRHTENTARLTGIEAEGKKSNENQRIIIDTTQELLSLERANRALETPVLPQRPSDDTTITAPPVSTGTQHGF